MKEFVSKSIHFSEPETILSYNPDLSEKVTIEKGIIGISVLRLDKTRKEKITNITFSKVSDSSYQKNYDRIEFLDRSTKAEQIEQTGETEIDLNLDFSTLGNIETDGNSTITANQAKILQAGIKSITPPNMDDDVPTSTYKYVLDESTEIPINPTTTNTGDLEETNTGNIHGDQLLKSIVPSSFTSEGDSTSTTNSDSNGSIKGYMSNAKSRTPAKNIFIYNAFNFNYSKQSLETNCICDIYLVREGFLYEMLKDNTNYSINGKTYTSQELVDEAPGKNYTRAIEDYKIEFENFPFLDTSKFLFLTKLSTADNSNYNYEINLNSDFDYILFLPSASPKSVTIKKPKLEIFYTKLLEDTNAAEIPPTEEGNFVFPSGEETPQNVGDYAALYNHLNKNAVEFFVKKYEDFINKFYNYDTIADEENTKNFYTLKNIKANINFNIEAL